MYKVATSWFSPSVVVSLLGAFVLFPALKVKAGSFALNEQSVSGLGSAYAGGAAQAEDASIIFFNPAGIALPTCSCRSRLSISTTTKVTS